MRWTITLAMLLVVGCANMEVAKIQIKDEGVKVEPAPKPIPYSIDTEYLESKFTNFFAVSHDEEDLKTTRRNFVDKIKQKIRNSMPPSATYVADVAKHNLFDQYLVFVPVLKIMPSEKDSMVSVRCDITARIYDRSGTRTSSIKASDNSSIPYSGSYAYIGTIEYYKTFRWEEPLLTVIEQAQNKALERTITAIMDKINKVQWSGQ